MVSMYPNTQPMAYTIDADGVFTPCPPSSIAGASNCPSCQFSGISRVSRTLHKLGFTKFSKIMEISGLQNLDSPHGVTIFAACDSTISDVFVENCRKLEAINIIKSSCINRVIPAAVICQRKRATYGSLNKLSKLRIVCSNTSMTVASDNDDPVNVLKTDIKDPINPKIIVHRVDNLIMPECML